LKKNAQSVLNGEKMYLVRNTGRTEIDPATVDWSTIKQKQIPYQLVQTSGYHNSLGIVKFNFPNPESVYLHDTPNKKAFGYRNRDVSHGCIRVEKPLELMQLIFQYNGYDDKQLELVMIDLGKAPTSKEGELYQEKRQQKEEEYKAKLPANKIYRPLRPNPYNLKKKLPVYLEYYTCFVGENGDIHYRNDVYEKEENVLRELKIEN
jgi:murein L,D-transpeptidase YcbB/YkuD